LRRNKVEEEERVRMNPRRHAKLNVSYREFYDD